LAGKHWKVQREFLSGYLENLTGKIRHKIFTAEVLDSAAMVFLVLYCTYSKFVRLSL
jgi:hypothetical protein